MDASGYEEMGNGADVCPMEDAIKAFLEYLVEPKLPATTSSKVTPSLSEQESVAKQVHAAVILYNYYHRKQHPQLEFLGFESFCKWCVNLKPTMMAHLKLMEKSGDIMPDDLEKHLSLTQRKVMEACDISAALDASEDNTSIQGWPISKVAIFLVDSKKKKCFLQFGTIVDGIWSMIEKDVDFSGNHSEGNMDPDQPINKKRRLVKKPSKDDFCIDEAAYRQLAYSAVKDVTGITENCLKVLEGHLAYSISKEKTAACLYIMQCTQQDNGLFQVPIEDSMNSMLGPLVMKSSSGWTHTSVVEFFHILPYHKLLLDWLSRKVPYSSFPTKKLAAQIVKADNLSGPESSPRNLKTLGSKTSSGSRDENEKGGIEMDAGSLNWNGNGRRCAESIPRGIGGFHKAEAQGLYVITSSVGKVQHFSNVRPHAHQNVEPCRERCLSKSSGHQIDLTEATELVAQHRITECQGGKGTREIEKRNISSYEDEKPTVDPALGTYHSKDLDKVHDLIASKARELSQAAIRVLLSRRDKLSLQQRDIEDQIAQCDKDIEAVLSGGEDCLALKIQSIIEGCNDACLRRISCASNSGPIQDQNLPTLVKRKREQDTDHCNQGPCQVLDSLCIDNDWILPNYRVSARDGGFRADVTVKGRNFKRSIEGSNEKDPVKARESAAGKMLTLLRQSNETL